LGHSQHKGLDLLLGADVGGRMMKRKADQLLRPLVFPQVWTYGMKAGLSIISVFQRRPKFV